MNYILFQMKAIIVHKNIVSSIWYAYKTGKIGMGKIEMTKKPDVGIVRYVKINDHICNCFALEHPSMRNSK